MKHLPWRSQSCLSSGATLPVSNAFPAGEPHLTARYVQEYKCARCGDVNRLTAAEYNALPELSLADYKRLAQKYGPALRDLPTRDLEATGLKREHAEDMFNAGLTTAHDVEDLSR